jgi:hypothetical protein
MILLAKARESGDTEYSVCPTITILDYSRRRILNGLGAWRA